MSLAPMVTWGKEQLPRFILQSHFYKTFCASPLLQKANGASQALLLIRGISGEINKNKNKKTVSIELPVQFALNVH